MKKVVVVQFLCVLTVLLLVIGCGGKYSDAKKMNEKYINLVKDYIADLDKSANAADVAKAINRFADGMEVLVPKMQKLSEKYPELKDRANPPEELKESRKRAEEVGYKMGASMMKIMPYMSDPEVQKAQKRFGAFMMKKQGG